MPTEPQSPEPVVPAEPDFDARVRGIAALDEPVRRDLYRYVAAQPAPVSRDEAAAGVGVARHVAKFHLDRLAEDGLLEVEYARPPGRSGPGAGRPAKRYRRSAREVVVSVPERHYELAGRLLARAVTDAEREGVPVHDALHRAARDVGAALGARVRARITAKSEPAAVLAATSELLAEWGYEPRTDEDGMSLVNCPFHALAQEYTELVCGMNLELLQGVADALEDVPFEPRLDPAPGRRCCVRLLTSTME